MHASLTSTHHQPQLGRGAHNKIAPILIRRHAGKGAGGRESQLKRSIRMAGEDDVCTRVGRVDAETSTDFQCRGSDLETPAETKGV